MSCWGFIYTINKLFPEFHLTVLYTFNFEVKLLPRMWIWIWDLILCAEVTSFMLQNAQFFEPNSALCKVCTKDSSYVVRCDLFVVHLVLITTCSLVSRQLQVRFMLYVRCSVKGSLLEVNDRLMKQPELLNTVVRMTFSFDRHLQFKNIDRWYCSFGKCGVYNSTTMSILCHVVLSLGH